MNSKQPDIKPTHRDKQRRTILEALAEVVKREGVHAFSVQQVADEAGLSHRTVYRYFPTREDLLEGLVHYYEDYVRDFNPPPPDELLVLSSHVGQLFRRFEQYPNECSVGAIGSLVLGKQLSNRATRDEQIFEVVRKAMPPEHDVSPREAGAIIRYLANSLTWIVLRQQLGLSEDETVRAVEWALDTLAANLTNPACDKP
jgi:AcrR family transcriptional regulator